MTYTYKENSLTYDIYFSLRESVNWNNFCEEQAVNAIKNSYYTITVFDKEQAIGMGRVVGDGIYFTIVDVVVRPDYQGQKVGSSILDLILKYLENSMCAESCISIQLISEVGKEDFYIKQGFELIPHENCGPALRKIIYKKYNE